jgi:hypothetical protein
MSKVTIVPHLTKRIVRIDFTGCGPGKFAPIIEEAVRVISAEGADTVLALTIFENVRFDPGTVLEMERFVSRVQPFLKADALVGITGLKKVVFTGLKPLFRKPVELFDAEDAAKAWLVAR